MKAGREVLLTGRGKPVAVIRPFRDGARAEAAIERMIAEGRLIPPTAPGPPPRRRWKPIRLRGVPLSRTLREERDAR